MEIINNLFYVMCTISFSRMQRKANNWQRKQIIPDALLKVTSQGTKPAFLVSG